MSHFYPLGITLSEAPVLVFGGSPSVEELLLRLLDSGAAITLVATLVCQEILALQEAYGRRLRLIKNSVSEFLADHNVGSYRLVFACNQRAELNIAVVAACQLAAVPVSVVGNAALSSFVVPTVLKRGNIKVAVSTDGLCPPLETSLLSRIEELFVAEFDRYAIFLGDYRERLEAAAKCGASELNQLTRILNGSEELKSALARKNFEEALRIVDDCLLELTLTAADSGLPEVS